MLYGKNKSEGKMVAEKVKLTQIMSELWDSSVLPFHVHKGTKVFNCDE